jgi:methyl-accepting chemotaxis protein
VLEELRTDPLLVRGEKAHQERALRSAVDRNSFIELAYATDARGMQVTQNVAAGDFLARYGNSGVGHDWSRRPWFRGALSTVGVFASDIYRSAATDEFCLTVSATYGGGAAPAGVVAVDVNFRQLLGA